MNLKKSQQLLTLTLTSFSEGRDTCHLSLTKITRKMFASNVIRQVNCRTFSSLNLRCEPLARCLSLANMSKSLSSKGQKVAEKRRFVIAIIALAVNDGALVRCIQNFLCTNNVNNNSNLKQLIQCI